MFDKIEQDGKIIDVYFDIENFKLKVNRYDFTVSNIKLNNEIIKLKNYVLFIKYNGKYNNYSTEYDVLFYIHTYSIITSPMGISKIIISSMDISYLLYSNNKRSCKYKINQDDYEFSVTFNRNNKMQKWQHYDIRGCGNVEIRIFKCNDWEIYGKIINSVIDSIYISLLNRRNNNFEIILSSNKQNNIGSIVFPKTKENNTLTAKISNFDIIKNDIKKVIIELMKTPYLSQYIIPNYSNYHTQLEFYKIYACFEYEYNLIEKNKIYNKEQKKLNKTTEKMKLKIEKLLKESDIEITDHYYRSLSNYNPMEGHKQKLRNAIEYANDFFSNRYNTIRFEKYKKEFIDYIYTTRIKIIHKPDDNIKIDNSYYLDVFNEIIFAMFLKRCGITNSRIEEITKNLLIPCI